MTGGIIGEKTMVGPPPTTMTTIKPRFWHFWQAGHSQMPPAMPPPYPPTIGRNHPGCMDALCRRHCSTAAARRLRSFHAQEQSNQFAADLVLITALLLIWAGQEVSVGGFDKAPPAIVVEGRCVGARTRQASSQTVPDIPQVRGKGRYCDTLALTIVS